MSRDKDKQRSRHAHGLASLYALGALNASDRAKFEAHIEMSSSSVEEVTALLPVTHRLAATAPPREAPSAMRERVLHAITRQSPPTASGETDGRENRGGSIATPVIPPTADDLTIRTDVDDGAAPAVESGGRRAGRMAPWLITLISIGAAGWAGWQWMQQVTYTQALQQNLDAANLQAIQSEEAAVAALEAVDAARAQVAILAAPDVETLHLAGQPAAPDASARWITSDAAGALFSAAGLPAPPPGRSYQLWFVANDAPISGGMLSVDDAGRIVAAVAPPIRNGSDSIPLVALAVTLEPEEGSGSPTGEVYLLGRPQELAP